MSSRSDWDTKWDQYLKGGGVDCNVYVTDDLEETAIPQFVIKSEKYGVC